MMKKLKYDPRILTDPTVNASAVKVYFYLAHLNASRPVCSKLMHKEISMCRHTILRATQELIQKGYVTYEETENRHRYWYLT